MSRPFLPFFKPSLEKEFTHYLQRSHEASEKAGLLFVAFAEWAFLRLVLQTRGFWSLGALLQFVLLVMPTTGVVLWRLGAPGRIATALTTTVK